MSVTHPRRHPLPERADPAALLIDAVINQQGNLAQKLGRQWVHRRGVVDFGAFLDGRLLNTCGHAAVTWLRDQLELSEAPIRHAQPTAQLSAQPAAATAQVHDPVEIDRKSPSAFQTSGPSALLPAPSAMLPAPSAVLASRSALGAPTPAPAPPSLAPLRAWLSDAA